MKALLQRVSEAFVTVEDKVISSIGPGLLVLLGVEQGDTLESCQKLADRVIHYRLFSDEAGKMNRSLLDMAGDCLVVSQFTLAADTRKGRRPGFSTAMPPEQAEPLVDLFVQSCRDQGIQTQTGQFGASMQVSLVNDGPVTFLLEVV